MNILLTIVWLGCLLAITCAKEDKKIEELLALNTEELGNTRKLIDHIDVTNGEIKTQLEQQRVWLAAITRVDEQLGKLNQFLNAQSVVVLEALNNVTLKAGQNGDRLYKDLENLNRINLSTKQQITSLENKLEGYQKYLQRNARSIENNILDLTKLVTRAVLPQLNALKCSFDSLDTSQINIEVELKGLARIKDINEDSNSKLYILGDQLTNLNRTQEARLSALTLAIKELNPINAWQIENALRELINSQKRIELDLEACEKRSSSHYPIPVSPAAYPESYEQNPPAPQAYELSPPAPQARSSYQSKRVNLSQVWSVKEPNHPGQHSGPYYASAYAHAPQQQAQHRTSSKPIYESTSSQSVSWQQPLPWEAATSYQSAPTPSKPNYSSPNHKRPQPSPKPCPSEQPTPDPNGHSAPAVYGPPPPPPQSYSHQYRQQGNQPGKPISWYSVAPPSERY